MGYYFHFSSFKVKRHSKLIENSGLKSTFLFWPFGGLCPYKCTIWALWWFAKLKVIYPKYSKHWLSTVAHTIDCVCSKILNHGLNHGLLFSLFKFFGWKNILN